jgi:hypothetical protein
VDAVAYTYNSSYLEGGARRIVIQGQLEQKNYRDAIS